MKKFVIFLLFVSFCGGSSETAIVEEPTTTSTSTTTTEPTTTTTTQPTTTTTAKVPQAPALINEICNETLNPLETTKWEYEVQIVNFNSKVVSVDWVVYLNDERLTSDRERFVVNEDDNDFYGLTSDISYTQDGYTIEIVFTVLTEDDLTQEISCETRILGAVDLNPTTTTTSTTTTTTSTTTTTTSTTTTTIPVINDVYTGSGDDIVSINQYNQLVVAYIVGNSADDYFAVIPYLDDRRYISIVSTTEPYEGVTILNFDGDNPNTLEVKAKGNWSITLKSVSTQRSFTGSSITGVGDEVIQFPDNKNNLQILTITGNNRSEYFAVIPYDCNGKRRISLVSETEPYSGKVRSSSGACYLEIKAGDEWTISR